MNDTRAMLVIARRELLERVRSKWFLVGTIVGPIAMIAMLVVPVLIATSSTAGTKVEIIDKSKIIGVPLATVLNETEKWDAKLLDSKTSEDVEIERIRTKQINGFITIAEDGLFGGHIEYQGDNGSSQNIKAILAKNVQGVVFTMRAKNLGLTDTDLKKLGTKIDFESLHNTGEKAKGESGMGAFFLAYILAFILYIVITLYGVGVMRSVVMEKTSRVMEMMVAAVKPRALMAGKILGVGGAGLIQIAIWLTIGALLLTYNDVVLGWFGAKGASPTALPPFAGVEVVVVLSFFVLGFFFYAAMYAAVGAMVSSEQDTQQVQMPVTMLLVIGVVCLQVISNAPRGGAATVMSNVPLWSPMLMPMRYVLGGATLGEVGISLGILVVSTLLVVRAAAKIYRVGVLMYGKRPSLRELVRWLRY